LPYAVTSQNDFENRTALEQKQIPYTAFSQAVDGSPFRDFVSEPSIIKGSLSVLSGQQSGRKKSNGLKGLTSLDEAMLTSLFALDPNEVMCCKN
jgi:hypothetical protein